jgi:hypothetical protein
MTRLSIAKSETDAQRDDLRIQPGCYFVSAAEFRQLIISHRKLERADVPRAALRGLLDPQTGARFVTEDEKLYA